VEENVNEVFREEGDIDEYNDGEVPEIGEEQLKNLNVEIGNPAECESGGDSRLRFFKTISKLGERDVFFIFGE
jgi:hypothetical protein